MPDEHLRYSQGLSPAETLCGPLVVTVFQAAWCGHVCHIPPTPLVIPPDGGLYHGYRPVTLG